MMDAKRTLTPSRNEHEELMRVLLEEGALRKLPHQARSTQRVISMLEAATRICLEQGLEHINTAAIANKTKLPIGTVYQFFENREAVIRAVVVRANYQTTQLMENVIRKNGAIGNWLTDGPTVWDHYVDTFLQDEELVATVRKVGHLREYQETSQRRFDQALDTFVRHMEQAGIQPTPEPKTGSPVLPADVQFPTSYGYRRRRPRAATVPKRTNHNYDDRLSNACHVADLVQPVTLLFIS